MSVTSGLRGMGYVVEKACESFGIKTHASLDEFIASEKI
tara:strand:+ start:458 stop:574 length:117 start_codon:yes stop_codon:yes gene_type:complete